MAKNKRSSDVSENDGRLLARLLGHTKSAIAVTIYRNAEGREFVLSCSDDFTIRIWDLENKSQLCIFEFPAEYGMAVTQAKRIALFCDNNRAVSCLYSNDLFVWDLTGLSSKPTTLYTNAKAVLVGDSGVGKSGLRLVMQGQPFAPTESTHARFVTEFDSREITLANGQMVKCETLLWDLA